MIDNRIETAQALCDGLMKMKAKNPDREIQSLIRDAVKFKYATYANLIWTDYNLLQAVDHYLERKD